MKCYDCNSENLELLGYITEKHRYVSKERVPDVVLYERYRCKNCRALLLIEPKEAQRR